MERLDAGSDSSPGSVLAQGLKLDSVSYATLIEAYALAGQLTAAQSLGRGCRDRRRGAGALRRHRTPEGVCAGVLPTPCDA